MSDYEKDCYTCKYLKQDEHKDPCRQCFAYDAWEPIEKDAEKTVKDWERRIFDGNSTKC